MFIVEFAPKAARQIAKLEESSKQSIKTYLKGKVMTAKIRRTFMMPAVLNWLAI